MTGPSDRADFRLILTAVTERPLTGWERQQLWQILARHPEWIPEYVEQCELPGLFAELDAADLARAGVEPAGAPIIPIHRDGDSGAAAATARSRSPGARGITGSIARSFAGHRTEWIAALASAAAFVLVLGLLQRRDESTAGPRALSSGAVGDKRAHLESPQETYERVSATLPVKGSLSRPATKFNAVDPKTPTTAHGIRFDEQIRPVLSEYCFACHGPGKQKSGLRLDTRAGATADLDGNTAIVPGKPESSELVRRIETGDADDVMPPPDSHKKLPAAAKALLRQWVAEGATYEQHWAFVPPHRPAVPTISAPPADWSQNPIDAFVLARMRQRGLGPNPPADRYDLARRAALDVLGLPPSPEQVETFVRDSAPDAYERYLAALFQSPHFGEHQARFWLDAARYGDTHGMHLDNYREMWTYRDWVINAFNRNLPFDQFITEQIAGDLLDSPTESQRIATGFGRCNISTSEGGSIPEEVAVRYMVDRTENFSTVFLGLTAVCASCHDHKYDPITQKDFYSLGAFFNNTTQPAMDGNRKDSPPVLVLPSEQDRPRWERLMAQRQQLRDQMQRRGEALAGSGAFAAWASRMRKGPGVVVDPIASDGLALWVPFESTDSRELTYWVAGQRRRMRLPEEMKPADGAPTGRGLVFSGKKPIELPTALALADDQPLTISVWVKAAEEVKQSVLLGTAERPLSPAQIAALAKEEAADADPAKSQPKSHRKVLVKLSQDNSVQTSLGNDPRNSTRGQLPSEVGLTPAKWHHLVIRYSGSRLDDGITYWVDGEPRETRQRNVPKPLKNGWRFRESLQIGADAQSVGLSDLRIFQRYLSDDEVSLLGRVNKQAPLAQASDELLRQYHANVVDPGYRRLARKLATTQGERDAIAARSTTTLVMEERRDQRPRAWLLERGEYDKRKQEVQPAAFGVLPPLPAGVPRNRLGLAKWLTMRDNPLVARVTVNRLWQQLFGTGLVRTTEDFGTMGERPSHPELLDWLAVEFVDSGWDVKRLLRLMMTSAAYRQSAQVSAPKLAADPDNRLLTRGPRVRLDAEVLRDQALAASSLLVPELGGSPVKPYQPELWKTVAFVGSNTGKFVQDHGARLYRRSIYSFWKRTSPPPSMTAFDAPSRESCTVRRERTNTPLQALVLLNDPQYVEAARALAALAMRKHPDDSGRADEIFRRVRGRPADEKTAVTLVETARAFRESFVADHDAAQSLLAVGESPLDRRLDPVELATWTMVSNTVFNRDDVINKN